MSTSLAFPSGQRAWEGHPFSSEAEAHGLHPSASSPSSQSDSSSVDGDNSIELDIWKVLSKKDRESMSGLEMQRRGFPPGSGWGVCPGQSHCAGRWWPQPWAHRARRAGGPLSQLRTGPRGGPAQSRPPSPLLCPEASWCPPAAAVGLCLPEGHLQV